jgi:hypothetical protein
LVLEGEGDGNEEWDDHGKRVSSELEQRWGDMVMWCDAVEMRNESLKCKNRSQERNGERK